MKILLDTNVIIDVLQDRKPWSKDGKKIFYAIADQSVSGFVTSKQIADIHYLSRRQFAGMENADKKARGIVLKLSSVLSIIDTLGADCMDAIVIDNNDYEDAMLIICAARMKMDCIVTRNKDHFRQSPIPVYSPSELVNKLDKHN
jgi:predicted nucleic acid-binding protein